ncbi:MAG: hypothetical protein K2O42_03835 [Oscillospiraceae bacterium]|nr:hypothetical protein [Oscillospiraceae bacterium]
MANRPAFCCTADHKIIRENFEFTWFPGFAVSQKQKSIASLHGAILRMHPGSKILEISTKSESASGKKLSAFRLKYRGYFLENIFQSSKLFEHGGSYQDLLTVSPKEAKRDPRLRNSGALTGFLWDGIFWGLETRSAFYDFIYLKAVKESLSAEEMQEIQDYQYFTDIEFNPAKSRNTQARSVAILRLFLELYQEIPDFSSEEFLTFHKKYVLD